MLTRSLAGGPDAGDFRVVDEALPEPADGECRVRHLYLSLDPYQRSAMAGRHRLGRGPLVAGDMPAAETLGQVLRSRHRGYRGYREGDYVRHFGGWQEYALSTGERTARVDPALAPLSAWLGVLGMPGLTAWASAVELAAVQAGQTVLVSAALGPVGSLVGQLLADAFSVLKVNGTVILCGLMERYNDPAKSKSLDLALPIMKRAVMKGLVVSDFEHRRPVFEAAGAHFARLMRGENVGKALVVLGPEAATWAVDTLYARGGRLPNLGQVAPVATGALDILIKFIYLGFSVAAALAVLLKGFGSVHVNGVHVETTGASFTVDDGRAQSTVLTW